MAASFTFSSYYSKLLSLAMLSMLVGSSWAGRRANLRSVCSQTTDSVLCMRLLYPNTRNSDGDSRSIANAAIDLAYNKASEIGSNNYGYPEWPSCYTAAMSDLDQSRRLLGDGDYRQLEIQVKHAAEEARRCRRNAESLRGDYDRVKRINDQIEVLCNAVRVCAEILSSDDDNS